MRPQHLSLFREPGRPAPHPDGTWAAVTISRPDLDGDRYASSIWRLDTANGALTPLTYGTADSSPALSPDGRWLAFVRGGDGTPQLALLPTSGGEPVVVTAQRAAVGNPVFSPDSARVAFTSRVPEQGRYGTDPDVGPDAEAPRLIDRFTYRSDGIGFKSDRPTQLFVVDVPATPDPLADPPARQDDTDDTADMNGSGTEPGAAREVPTAPGASVTPVQLTSGPLAHTSPVWLDAEHLLAHVERVDTLGTGVVRVALHGTVEPLDVPGVGLHDVVVGAAGQLWALVADYGDDGMDFIGSIPALHRITVTASSVEIGPALTDRATRSLGGPLLADPRGGVLATEQVRGTTGLVRFDGEELTTLVDGPLVVSQAAVLGTEGAVLVSAAAPDSVGDVYRVEPDGSTRRLTDLSQRLRAEAGVIDVLEHVADNNGYPVHGWVATPPGEGPHPVLLLIHGGPDAAYTPAFFDEVQTYAAAGYAVVFCNPRGSASYGREHSRAVIGGFGTVDADDIMAFLDDVLTREDLDAERVGVLGGSYGGYMTAWLTAHHDRWAGAIVERGFLDPVSFTGSSDIGWFFGRRYLGEAPEKVAAQSPMTFLDQVTTPTLVIHSEHDWRCPVEQGQRWFVGLKQRGVPTELLLFPGEGHELSRSGRPKHRLARFEHVLRWWQRHLPVD